MKTSLLFALLLGAISTLWAAETCSTTVSPGSWQHTDSSYGKWVAVPETVYSFPIVQCTSRTDLICIPTEIDTILLSCDSTGCDTITSIDSFTCNLDTVQICDSVGTSDSIIYTWLFVIDSGVTSPDSDHILVYLDSAWVPGDTVVVCTPSDSGITVPDSGWAQDSSGNHYFPVNDPNTNTTIILNAGSPLSGNVWIAQVDSPGVDNGEKQLVKAIDVTLSSSLDTYLTFATLTIYYGDLNLGDVDENTLAFYHLNQSSGKWEITGGTVDTNNKTITVTVTHFSIYGLFGDRIPISVSPVLSLKQGFSLLVTPSAGNSLIRFSLKQETAVKLSVYSIQGKLIRSLINDKNFKAGQHSVKWNGLDRQNRKISSGMYLVTFETPNKKIVRHLNLMK